MSYTRSIELLETLLGMAPQSPPSEASSSPSLECSPMCLDSLNVPSSKPAANQNCPLLKLPVDIFKCVTDYLDRDAAWNLKRLCRGMASSETVDQLLYQYPIQLNDVRDLRLGDWKYRSTGYTRWESFKESITDRNRKYVQKLAMSHWCSIDDFRWVEENLPSLTSLDISAIKDFVWTPEETWTWKMVADTCPKLFGRIEDLEVSNWADYTAHSRIEYSYSYNDYRFKQKFRISRRRDGGSVAKMIFPICKKLKSLAVRERYSGFNSWNEWEVHQRVCCLVDGIQKYCPSTLTKLRVHDYAPYRALFSTDAVSWPGVTDIDIGLYSWMEDRRDRDIIGPVPYRITQGHHHLEEEDAFGDKTFESCDRDHMSLGNCVVQGVGASFTDLLLSLQAITQKYPNINIKPINSLRDVTLHPFHLVNVQRRRHQLLGHAPAQTNSDPVSDQQIQESLRWLAEKCDWRPILAWDSMMCDVFPANLEPGRTFLPKPEVLSRIRAMVSTLRTLNIPIRISIGDRLNTCTSSGLDGSLYFGDYKTFIGEDENRREVLLPSQACFNLTPIASMVDELTIQYPVDVPGIGDWKRASKRPSPAEKALMDREMKGWRRFWARYACQFKNLKKLVANVPNDIYNDWAKSEELQALLSDERWEMLEISPRASCHEFFSYFPVRPLPYSISRKRPRVRTVQRIFFRQDQAPLDLPLANPNLSEEEREENEIPDDDIKDKNLAPHRFWEIKPAKEKSEKRKREPEAQGEGVNGVDGDAKAEQAKKLKSEHNNSSINTAGAAAESSDSSSTMSDDDLPATRTILIRSAGFLAPPWPGSYHF